MKLDSLPLPQRVALAYAPARMRPAWLSVIQFDLTLANVVAQAREPMLRQLRLAWWRDALSSNEEHRDPTLVELAAHFPNALEQFRVAVDGWEELAAPEQISESALTRYARGRAGPFVALAELMGIHDLDAVRRAGAIWALGDFAAHASDLQERITARRCAEDLCQAAIRLPRTMRPLAVLSALSRRAMVSGDRGLLADRSAALLAMRVGILGR